METLVTTLRLVESIPHLGEAFALATKLAELAKEIKEGREDVRSLVEHASEVTRAIYNEMNAGTLPVDPEKTPEHIDTLLSTLNNIHNFAQRRNRNSIFHFISRSGDIKSETDRLRKALQDACDVFQIQTSIQTHQQISHLTHTQAHLIDQAENSNRVHADLLHRARGIDSNVKDILHRIEANATSDGTMRLYGREDLVLIEELGPESPIDDTGECPVRYRARVRATGNGVIVRRFPQANEQFRAAVDTAKKVWHPNVAHALGYSKPDPQNAFIVIDGSLTRTFNALSRTYHGVDRLIWTMQFSKQIYAGLTFLQSIQPGLEWTPDRQMEPIMADHELLISEDGRVLLDVVSYNFNRLPNTLIHDDGMVELNTRGRQLVKTFKNPLNANSSANRFQLLKELWRNLARFADFSREESMIWTNRFIPLPGQCFTVSRQRTLDGLEYEDLIEDCYLRPEYKEPQLHLDRDKAQSRLENDHCPNDPESKMGACATVQHDVVQRPQDPNPWRRYTIRDMDYGWTLRTTTCVRENKDCRGWFMNNAPDFCHITEDPADLGIAYALKFHTQTTLTKAWNSAPEETPPPMLFYYEHVHRDAYVSLEPSIEWPWGFWSTSPDDACDIGNFAQSHLPRSPTKHRIAYMGISSDGKHVWTQLLGRWMFVIEVQVEVEYYNLTPDECLVLEEMRRCASQEDRADSNFEVLDDEAWSEAEDAPGFDSPIPHTQPEEEGETAVVENGRFATIFLHPQLECARWPTQFWTPHHLSKSCVAFWRSVLHEILVVRRLRC